jgi:hypothetical protein
LTRGGRREMEGAPGNARLPVHLQPS